MSPDVLEREEVSVDQNVQQVPQGFSGQVVPSMAFGEVVLDPWFTGAGSRDACAPYFSQLDNLDDVVLIATPYAPGPVQNRVVYVSFRSASVDQSPCYAPSASDHEALASEALGLAEITQRMRDLVDLPVQDLARMCGIGRRQYYNLMRQGDATRTSAARERHVRLVHHQLEELHDRLGSPSSVRASVLMPLEGQGMRSLLDVGSANSVESLRVAYDELVTQLNAGVELSRQNLPPSGTYPPGDERWAEADAHLRGYADADADE